jgi:hypothetical protein
MKKEQYDYKEEVKKWLKIRPDAQIRVGDLYQATIPEFQPLTKKTKSTSMKKRFTKEGSRRDEIAGEEEEKKITSKPKPSFFHTEFPKDREELPKGFQEEKPIQISDYVEEAGDKFVNKKIFEAKKRKF